MKRSRMVSLFGWVFLGFSWLPASWIHRQPSPWFVFTVLAACVFFAAADVIRAIEASR